MRSTMSNRQFSWFRSDIVEKCIDLEDNKGMHLTAAYTPASDSRR